MSIRRSCYSTQLRFKWRVNFDGYFRASIVTLVLLLNVIVVDLCPPAVVAHTEAQEVVSALIHCYFLLFDVSPRPLKQPRNRLRRFFRKALQDQTIGIARVVDLADHIPLLLC